jgi:hypothetical protein
VEFIAFEHLGPGVDLESHQALGKLGPHISKVLRKEFSTVRVQTPTIELLHDVEQEEQVVLVDLLAQQVAAYLLIMVRAEVSTVGYQRP